MWKYHGPRANIGSMRDRVTIQSSTSTQDTAKQPIRTWSDWMTGIPASMEIVSGGETLRGRQIEAGVTAVFTARWMDGITPMHRLYHEQEEKFYGIVKVEPADDRRQFMFIQCKRIANQG